MSRSSVAGLLAGTAVASVLLGGVAYASASPAASTPSPSTTSSASPSAAPKAGRTGRAAKHAPLAARAAHGEFTVTTKKGPRTVLVQRGTVSAVTPASGSTPGTVTVVSADRFSATYTVPATAKVLAGGRDARKAADGEPATATLKAGERVRVLARENASTATLTVARVLPAQPARAAGTSGGTESS